MEDVYLMTDVDETLAPAFLTDKQAAVVLCTTKHQMYLMRRKGDGPPFVMFGVKVRYPHDALQEWMRNQPRFTSRAQAYAAHPQRAHAAERQRTATARARKTRWPAGLKPESSAP